MFVILQSPAQLADAEVPYVILGLPSYLPPSFNFLLIPVCNRSL